METKESVFASIKSWFGEKLENSRNNRSEKNRLMEKLKISRFEKFKEELVNKDLGSRAIYGIICPLASVPISLMIIKAMNNFNKIEHVGLFEGAVICAGAILFTAGLAVLCSTINISAELETAKQREKCPRVFMSVDEMMQSRRRNKKIDAVELHIKNGEARNSNEDLGRE